VSSFLVTGGAGFAGSHLVAELLRQGHDVVSMDRLTYAGSLGRLRRIASDRLKIVHHDFRKPIPGDLKYVDYIIHNGAESHVMRSLKDPGLFVESNVLGTLNLLNWARGASIKFVYVSTDEVFGPAGDEPYHEGDRLRPTNPYSATKAGGEYLVRSYFKSFGVPALITRTVNLFGEMQHPEKFIPQVIKRILSDREVEIHAEEDGTVGSRSWVYVGEQARALAWLAQNGDPGKAYHVTEGIKKSNLEIAKKISAILDYPMLYRFSRYEWPGHDRDYSLSTKGTPECANWKSTESFEELLTKTVLWYRDHQEWLA
jgi:dTDP-glucose 4,6-dehydratase